MAVGGPLMPEGNDRVRGGGVCVWGGKGLRQGEVVGSVYFRMRHLPDPLGFQETIRIMWYDTGTS